MNMLSSSGLGPLLNDRSLNEALLNEKLLIESLLIVTVSGVVRDLLFLNGHTPSLLDLLVLDALCDDEEPAGRGPDDKAEEPEELRATGAPPRTPRVPEIEDLCGLPGRVLEMEGLLD